MVTETDEVAAALDAAARKWPADSRSRGKLLLRMLNQAHHAIEAEDERRKAEWHAIVESTSGTFDYGPDPLKELREDWPE